MINFFRWFFAWLECLALGHVMQEIPGRDPRAVGLSICTRCGELHVEEEETDT